MSRPPRPDNGGSVHGTFQQLHEDQPQEQATPGIEQLAQQIRETADKLVRDDASRADMKLVSTALKELRYAFKVFKPFRHLKKVSVFGSARLPANHPCYAAAVAFSRRLAEAGYMIIT